MASGGKGGAGGGSYNYFGRVAAVVGIGPLTRLHAVLVDGKAIFEGDLDLVETPDVPDDAPVPVPNIDGKHFADGSGYLKLMRGNDEQVMPDEFAHLPNYRGLAVLLFHKFLFGKEKSTVPNIEIIATRTPVAPPALVAGTHNALDDGQCNPVAFLAEIFTSPFGAFRFGTDRFVADDWLGAAEWCFGRKSRTFCSPFFNSQADARKVAAELLAMFDGALYFDMQGRLGLRLLKPGVSPGSMPLLDAPVWSEGGAPKQDGLGWSEIPARIDVEFTDRDRKYKNAPEPAKNLIASRVLGLEDTRTISMPHVTRRQQAADWGNELVRRSLKPASPIKLSVRRTRARSLGLEPGMKVRVDIDPEPGGAGLAQTGIIEELRSGPTGPVSLVVRPDTLTDAIPYAPDYGTGDPDDPLPVDGIEHALVIPLPPPGFPGPLSFAVLATRPAPDVIGMRVLFDADEDGTYAELGTQSGFACRVTLLGAILTGGSLTAGDEYEILSVDGGASFTAVGAATDTVGLTFTAADDDEDETTPPAPEWGDGGKLRHIAKASSGATTLRLQLTDGADGADAYLANFTAGSEIAARNDVVHIVLARVDPEDGFVTVGEDGRPEMEILSVVTRSPVEIGNTEIHDYAVLRARRSLPARAWSDCVAWIIPGASLVAWSHEAVAPLLDTGGTGYVRLIPYRTDAENTDSLIEELPLRIPSTYDVAPKITWDTPSEIEAGDTVDVAFEIRDAEGDLVSVRLERRASTGEVDAEVLLDRQGMPLTAAFSYDQATVFAVGTWSLTVTATDATGHTRQLIRHVTRPEDGDTVLPPVFTRYLGPPQYADIAYFMIRAPNALYIEVWLSTAGAPAAEWYAGRWNSEAEPIGMHRGRRLWARAYQIDPGTGVWTYSQWVYADYPG